MKILKIRIKGKYIAPTTITDAIKDLGILDSNSKPKTLRQINSDVNTSIDNLSKVINEDCLLKSDTSGLVKNDGTIDKTKYGTYTLPTTGVPKGDLSSDVLSSLDKADSALLSYTESDPIFVASPAHDITDIDIAAWNAKSDFSGEYSDLANKPDIPSKISDLTNDSNFVESTTVGLANGIASLDANGQIPSSLLPTSASTIVGYLDAANIHTLSNASNYTSGDIFIVSSDGTFNLSTAFTLTAGNKLTELEVSKANTLINTGIYVFTLVANTDTGDVTLGTVKSFATNSVTVVKDEIESTVNLPYSTNLSASSTPDSISITVKTGDEIMNINNHWVTLLNTNSVTSVNSKSGAVTLTASDVGAQPAEIGKGLSTNDYTTAELTKLAGIAEGAEVNVLANWNVTDTTSDAYILNKPTNLVTTDTTLTISGLKTFTGGLISNTVNANINGFGISSTDNLASSHNIFVKTNSSNPLYGLKSGNYVWYMLADDKGKFYFGLTSAKALYMDQNGSGGVPGTFTVSSIIKSGGTSSQFLKADGSVDETSYAPASTTLSGYGITDAVSNTETITMTATLSDGTTKTYTIYGKENA